MPFKIAAINERGDKNEITLDKLPHECPACNRAVRPEVLSARYVSTGNHRVRVVFVCPVDTCQEVFIGAYNNGSINVTTSVSHLQQTHALRAIETVSFPPAIHEISALFCETYNQANIADANDLDQIAGLGYRKALEFLIKDFLINYKFKEDAETANKVGGMFLGKCISDLIDEDRIKQCASRAAWLGNDETHYTRKWEEKDINDLKALLNMTVNWIDLVIQSDIYLKDMTEDKKETLIQGSSRAVA